MYFFFTLKVIQDYTEHPKTVNFSPKSLPSRSLRSKVSSDLDADILVDSDQIELSETSEQIEPSDTVDINTEPGKFYVVFGDCILGYYLVKCLSSGVDHFHGRYLTICSENAQGAPDNTIIFKETNEKDNFEYESLVSEVSVVTEVLINKKKGFAIEKAELNEIVVSVMEMSDDR